MPSACPKCDVPLGSSFRYGHLQFRITCGGCGARLQGNWVVTVLAVICGAFSLSGKSVILAGAAGGVVIGLWVEAFRWGSSRWARFTEDPD